MASKGVIDRQRSSAAVAAVGTAQAEVIGSKLAETLSPLLERGEKAPDFALVANLASRWLTSLTGALVDADAAHEAELGDDAAPREARDAGAAALEERLVELRQQIIGVFGPKVATSVGFKGSTSREPLALTHLSKGIETKLRSTEQPKAKIKGAHLVLSEIADELAALRAPIEAALGDVTREAREAQVTLAAKNGALATNDTGFRAAATLLEGLLLAAGQTELADKVKPSLRRPGETAVATDGAAEGAAASAGDATQAAK